MIIPSFPDNRWHLVRRSSALGDYFVFLHASDIIQALFVSTLSVEKQLKMSLLE